MNLRVELADHDRAGLPFGRIGDLPTAKHVVEDHQAARPEQLQHELVVVVVFAFLGVDEREVERAGSAVLDQAAQRIDGRPDAKIDTLADSRLEVVIERAGKPMAVVIPAGLYQALERDREGRRQR